MEKIRKKFFLTNVKFEFANVPPPPKESEKIFLSEDRFELVDIPPSKSEIFLSEVKFELADVPPTLWNQKFFFFYLKSDLNWLMYPSTPQPQDWKKSSKNEMFVFGLRSTSDDQTSNLSDESQPKCEKRPRKSSKIEMLIS